MRHSNCNISQTENQYWTLNNCWMAHSFVHYHSEKPCFQVLVGEFPASIFDKIHSFMQNASWTKPMNHSFCHSSGMVEATSWRLKSMVSKPIDLGVFLFNFFVPRWTTARLRFRTSRPYAPEFCAQLQTAVPVGAVSQQGAWAGHVGSQKRDHLVNKHGNLETDHWTVRKLFKLFMYYQKLKNGWPILRKHVDKDMLSK